MRFTLLTFVSFLIGFSSFSQVSSVKLSTKKCAHIFSRIDINYNSTTFDVSTIYNRGVTYYNRGFIEFDLSGVPSDAIIISATLKITNAGGTYVVNPWVTKLVQSSWGETTVKASNQPAISSTTSDWETSYTTTGNDVEIDVKSTVQRMVYGAVPNYGWSIQVEDESVAYDSGTSFHSDEASSNQPELEIVYYKPVTFSNVNINHESATSAADGSISFSHTALDGKGHTYTWYNSSGTQIQTGSTSTIEDLSYGWYGLEIEGNSNGETFYYGFLVGTECEEVTISYTELPNFVDNNYTTTLNASIAYPNATTLRAESWTSSGVWYDSRCFMRYRTWLDDAFTINQADYDLDNYPASWGTHYSSASPTNVGKFNIITEDWNEDFVSHNLRPSSSSSTHAVVSTTGSGYSTASKTIDMTELWEEWKVNNNTNYGCVYELDNYSNIYNKQVYTSANYPTSSYHPVWTFKLELTYSDNPIFCGGADEQPYNVLRREIDGGYGESYDDTLNIVFDENYGVDTNLYLITTIYDDDHDIIASCDIAGATTGGMPSLPWVFDDNRYEIDLSGITSLVNGEFYLLEAKNAKGERFYLKFKHNE